jgi:hypothetical protein
LSGASRILEQVFGGDEEVGGVGESVLDRAVVLVIAVAGVLLVEVPLVVAGGDDVGRPAEGAAADRAGAFKGETFGAVVAVVEGEALAGARLGRLGDHVDHAAGRAAAVDGGVGALDDLHAVDVAGAVAAEAEEAVAELEAGAEAAEVEVAADIEVGEAADVHDVVGEFEDTEVFEEFRREDVHGVGQVDDLGGDAGAGHGLGGRVTAVGVGGDGELGEADNVVAGAGGAGRGRGRRGGLGAGGAEERQGRERKTQAGEAKGGDHGGCKVGR